SGGMLNTASGRDALRCGSRPAALHVWTPPAWQELLRRAPQNSLAIMYSTSNLAPKYRKRAIHPIISITSSAEDSSDWGTTRSSAFAVLRLITSSYLVGAKTGRSA